MTNRPLYIWLDSDPMAAPPDATIPDTPGISDLDLIVQAIVARRFGAILPAKLAISQHERPHSPSGYRRVDIGRLLHERRIPHRKRFEVLLDQIPKPP